MGYIKSITNNPIPNYSRGMEFGANPGYSIFFSNNYSPTMIIANNGNVGIGNATPAFKLDIKSSLVQYNNNTNLLSLGGLNPVLSFKDQNDIFVGYIKSITNNPIPGYSRGMEFGADPGNSIFFSTNYSPTMIVANSGNVGIGTVNPTYKLSVNGNIRSKEVVVESGWADYVFTKNYSLPSLTELKSFIQKNNHLPDIPSAKEVGEKGLELGNMQKKMMEKIEELTLYILQLKSEIDQLKSNKK
jgi:hypothetical protein